MQSRLPDPTRPDPSHLPATTRPHCAMGPMPPPLLPAFRRTKRAPAVLRRPPRSPLLLDESCEIHSPLCVLSAALPAGVILHPSSACGSPLCRGNLCRLPNAPCENFPLDACPVIPRRRRSTRPPASPSAQWSAPAFRDRVPAARTIHSAPHVRPPSRPPS